jgi:hypothetical protein
MRRLRCRHKQDTIELESIAGRARHNQVRCVDGIECAAEERQP